MRTLRLKLAQLILSRQSKLKKNKSNTRSDNITVVRKEQGGWVRAAGIIVLKKEKGQWKVLLLHDGQKYDLPKGRIEPDESTFEAALRETEEEAGITKLKFPWGKKNKRASKVLMYIGVTEQTPTLTKNPETNTYEHEKYEWVSMSEAKEKVKNYLHEAILWADNLIKD